MELLRKYHGMTWNGMVTYGIAWNGHGIGMEMSGMGGRRVRNRYRPCGMCYDQLESASEMPENRSEGGAETREGAEIRAMGAPRQEKAPRSTSQYCLILSFQPWGTLAKPRGRIDEA